jgi:hypothetical protein
MLCLEEFEDTKEANLDICKSLIYLKACLEIGVFFDMLGNHILLKSIRSSISMPIPTHYSYGPRKLNIILTQLRFNAFFLNYHLRKVYIISNAFDMLGNHILLSVDLHQY